MPSVSAPPTPLLPTSLNTMGALPRTPYSPSFPSELPRSRAKSKSFYDDDLKTPITPPAAYMDFLRSSIIAQTPTSATFSRESITSAPLSAGCTCHRQSSSRTASSSSGTSTKSASSTSTTSSTSSTTKSRPTNLILKNSSRESSTSDKPCCSNSYTFQAPPTPLRTPLSGTKRLRIPASPAFSPGIGNMSFCDSPVPIYASMPRTPIEEEDENSDRDSLEPTIRSAGGNNITSSNGCRHHGMGRKVLIRTSGQSALAKTARMSLMPAPKGKKRRVE